MTIKNTNIPTLRFAEFTDDWEVKKLGEIFQIFNGYAFSSSQKTEFGILWVKIADVGIQEMEYGSLSYLPLDFKEKHKRFLLKNGDYVVALTRPILNGSLKIARINNFFNNSLLNQRVGKIVSKNNTSFIYSFLQKSDLIKSIENNISGSDPPNLSPNEINRIKFSIPTLPEQTKIANFLTAIDDKIQQLSEQKSLLEQYKKGIMQKIFSREIRFKPNTASEYPDWEEKSLGEVATFSKGKGISKMDIDENGVFECIRYGELYTFYGETIKEIKSKTSLSAKELVFSEYNDVIIPASGETQLDIATASCVLKDNVALGGDLNIIKTKLDGVWLSYYLNNCKKKDIASLAQGISVVHLYASQLKTLFISIPSLPEQQKIATFLTGIDEKINGVKERLEATKAYKKGLLQVMFV